jgi:predicted deacetylase
MDDEGFAYCFDGYSQWDEIEDEEFHRLRNDFLKSMKDFKDYINNKVDEGRELELEGKLEDE